MCLVVAQHGVNRGHCTRVRIEGTKRVAMGIAARASKCGAAIARMAALAFHARVWSDIRVFMVHDYART